MPRLVIAAVVGVIVWMLFALGVGSLLRLWPAYAAVAPAYGFTLAMLAARLAIGAVATLLAGFVAAAVARGDRRAAIATGVLLLLIFVPEHIQLGAKFPLWYHIVFLASLVPLAWAGGRLRG